MVKADGVAVEDNQKMVAQAKQIHDFVAQLAAKEPAWAPAEAATAKRIPGFEAQLQKLQAMKTADEATCQKVKAEPVAAPTKKKGKK